MASVCIHKDNLGKILNYLHPNTFSNIESYKEGSFISFHLITAVVFEMETELEKN